MNLLLDTQAFLWYESGDQRITTAARQTILNPDNIKFISISSFWEIVIKNSLGKLDLHVSIDELLRLTGYSHLHITGQHLKMLQSLPFHHRDPFDRMLISQALHENLVTIGADKQFDLYGVKRVW